MQQELALAPSVPDGVLGRGLLGTLTSRWSMAVTLVVLNALDIWTTHVVLANGGEERNPVMEPVVDELWHGALVKLLCLTVVACLLARCPRDSRRVEWTLAAVCGWYLFVVAWNVTVIARLV